MRVWSCLAVGGVALLLGACNAILPAVYIPVIEPPVEVDVDTPLAHMVYRVQPKVLAADALERKAMPTPPMRPNKGEVMKQKRLSLPASLEALTAQVDAQASGIYPLSDGVEAFAVRNALIKNAKHSLDLQYYSLHKGLSSRLLIRELVRAADRGVKIRILIDDMDTLGRDKEMTILAAHENIGVRIFNPIRRMRGTVVSRWLMFVPNISTQHRRMHNKVWLADGVLGITGGRNIGDRYFNGNESDNFSDLDVLLGGAAVRQMQTSFDDFWNSAKSIPVEVFEKAPQADNAGDIQKMIFSTNALTRKERVLRHPYLTALDEAEHNVLPSVLPKLMWGAVDFYSDVPGKVSEPPPAMGVHVPQNDVKSGSVVFDALMPYILAAQHEVIIANPYFLPGDDVLSSLSGLVKRGVAVTVLTNSLESNDVPLVNGPYARYRLKLLKAGVRLYELRGFPDVEKTPQWRLPIFSWKGSRTALHTKAVVIDGAVSFVGSMNFDPRSIVWNTEVGVISKQQPFAQSLRDILNNAMSLDYSYAVRLDEMGRLEWRTHEHTDGRDKIDASGGKAINKKRSIDPRSLDMTPQKVEVFRRERGNFWRRLEQRVGAWLPETFL